MRRSCEGPNPCESDIATIRTGYVDGAHGRRPCCLLVCLFWWWPRFFPRATEASGLAGDPESRHRLTAGRQGLSPTGQICQCLLRQRPNEPSHSTVRNREVSIPHGGLMLDHVLSVHATGLPPSSRSSIDPSAASGPLRRRRWHFSARSRQNPCSAGPTGTSPFRIFQTPQPPCVKAWTVARGPGNDIGCQRLCRLGQCSII